MLIEAFENVAPYLSNLEVLHEFADKNNNKSEKEIVIILENMVKNEEGTLKTDFRILLNEVRKRINTEM